MAQTLIHRDHTVDLGLLLITSVHHLDTCVRNVQICCVQSFFDHLYGNSSLPLFGSTTAVNSKRSLKLTTPAPPSAATKARDFPRPSLRKPRFECRQLPVLQNAVLPSQQTISSIETAIHVLSGTLARTFAQACIHPIDTIKTRLQVSTPSKKLLSWQKGVAEKGLTIRLPYQSISFPNWLVKGPRDLYVGLTGAIIGTLPTAYIYFTAYEACKTFLQKRLDGPRAPTITHLVSASAGAVASSLVRVPTDIVRHRVQAYLFANVFEATITIIQKDGIRGLYRGFAATLMRDIPEIAIQFAAYDALRRALHKRQGVTKMQTWHHLALGGAAGALAASVTMPLDVLKTSLQCGGKKTPVFVALNKILQTKGWQGLFSGMGPRVTQTALMSALFFTCFEFWKQVLRPVQQPPADLQAMRLANDALVE